MGVVRQQRNKENVRDVVGKLKVEQDAGAISEKRRVVITAYAQIPGGPVGIIIGNEKALQEFQTTLENRVKAQNIIRELKVMLEGGEVPMRWYFGLAEKYMTSQEVARELCNECQHAGGLVIKPFEPKNKAELDFFIGEAAYFSGLFRNYYNRPVFPREIYSAMKRYIKEFHEYYNEAGKKLAELGFSGEERGLLLGCGLTAEWMKRLKFTPKEALSVAEKYPKEWRDVIRSEGWYRIASGLEQQ